ncbi:Modification methylase ScaI protein [Marine Group I thaumarchaeote SCGC AAA799-E16]|uniref:Type II methyltransferase n=4 Tax=Marine Group I TaxID=905826 RepID=A0A081RND5_9ARCH|nr:Modification methylase ScaI protein [Marine Group I thaumarchaeote SCGC AAA799-N04]KER06178.1 Modification methylase ScaI protein [Marine Group I thaumarchaeote SCGC AAA799-E16]KFM15516.1 Modification methylase ScaI protein [Marine Group I thaumarchaeote SCGC AAA799-D11]KFM19243.1 Modification methylase HpaI protein [Marine Group I thaumarchaeote SCGC RSA3]
MRLNQIKLGDNIEVLSKLEDNIVDLTITSPPYRNAIDYSMHAKHGNNPKKNYRGKLSLTVEEYIEDMTNIFSEVYRVTKEGGYCCIVIGNEINKGTLEPLPAMLTTELVRNGWQLHEEIVWHKVTGGANRAGSFVQHPYPSYFRANIMHEKILVMRKGKNKLRRMNYAFKNLNPVVFREIANSVWHIAPVPPGFLDHPCPYPEEIPYRLASLYSYEDDLILDPFNGAGQTTKIAKYMKRKFIGIDIQEAYVKYAKERLKEKPHLRHESLMLQLDENSTIPNWIKTNTWESVENNLR